MNELSAYFALLDRVSKAVDKLPRRAATEAVNFSRERFRAQNWVDNTTKPWSKRKPIKGESKKRGNRAILVDSGRLRRSIRTVSINANGATIGSDVPYARAHNNGFRGRVNQRVKAHLRKGRPVKAHSRSMMLNIPQRQFIGESAVLEKRIERLMTAELMKAIKG